MLQEILALPVEEKIFYAVLVFSWTVYIWEAYLAYRQVSICSLPCLWKAFNCHSLYACMNVCSNLHILIIKIELLPF